MYSYLTDTNDVFRDINVAEIYNDNEQARTLLKRASGDFWAGKSVSLGRAILGSH